MRVLIVIIAAALGWLLFYPYAGWVSPFGELPNNAFVPIAFWLCVFVVIVTMCDLLAGFFGIILALLAIPVFSAIVIWSGETPVFPGLYHDMKVGVVGGLVGLALWWYAPNHSDYR